MGTRAERRRHAQGWATRPVSACTLPPCSEGRATVPELKRGLDSSSHLPTVKTASERSHGPRLVDAGLRRPPAPQPPTWTKR